MPTLYSQIRGHGEPVIFLHGLLSSSRIWEEVSKRIEKDHMVVILDLLGFGNSPKPHVTYSIEDHLSAVTETISSYHLTPPYVLVGQSIGGLLAIAYARKYPQNVQRIILISPPLFKTRDEAKQRMKTYLGIWYLFSYGLGGYIAHAIEQLLKPLLLHTLPHISKRWSRTVLTDTFSHTWQSYNGTMQHVVYTPIFYELCKGIRIPVTIIYGTDDSFIIPAYLNELVKENNRVKLIPVKGKHQFISEYTDIITEEIISS